MCFLYAPHECLENAPDKLAMLASRVEERERFVSGCQVQAVEQCYVIERHANHELCLGEHDGWNGLVEHAQPSSKGE